MILRKPYAFLIKYFKIIHIFMFLSLTYLVFALRKIYMFFVGYVKTNNFIYTDDMVKNYISPWMYAVVILMLISVILIYLLMHKKGKPVFFYRVLIIYCIFLLVTLIVYTYFFISLEVVTYQSLSLVIYRDIIAYLYYLSHLNFLYIYLILN